MEATAKTNKYLAQFRAMIDGSASAPPVAKLVGFTMVEAAPGRMVFELEVGPQHMNPMGTLHGGIVCDVADAAMGTAMATTLEDDETYTTIDLSAKYFKPVRRGKLRATATMVRRTRALGLIECDVTDEGGSLVARTNSTCMVLRGDDAKGR